MLLRCCCCFCCNYRWPSSLVYEPTTKPHTRKPTTEASVSETYCKKLVDQNSEVPEACKRFASVKAQLDAKNIENRFAGMSAGASSQVRKASLIRRMSTRQNQGKEKEKSSWF